MAETEGHPGAAPRFPTALSPTHVRALIRDRLPAAAALGLQTFEEVDARVAATREPVATVEVDGAPVPPTVARLRVVQRGHSVPVPPPVIVVDTREQQPYDFLRFRKWIGGTRAAALRDGDYTVEGCEGEFAVERKNLGDLVQSLGAARPRFVRALERLGSLRKKALVVEASLARAKTPYAMSEMAPNAVIGSLAAACARWDIQVVFASCRDLAEEWTASLLSKWWTYRWLRLNGFAECLIEGDI